MKKLTLLFMLVSITILTSSFAEKPGKRVKRKKSSNKAMIFPVAGKKSNIGSFWGADRDGGRRKHQGIDIFARKGTPVVAISDGYIIERDHTPIGGKTVWLRSASQDITAYYAHLDKQTVKEGQFVRKGQVLGTVGNTGNARTTPSHLHFGIYKAKGPINPLPYVKKAAKITAPKAKLVVKKPQTTLTKKGLAKQKNTSARSYKKTYSRK